jgi:acetolactate synthase-1/2/3 large subunit
MEALQRRIVDGSESIVLAESGNSFAWTTHHLRFPAPGRYRVSTGVGAMGHATAGVVGCALATGRKAVAVVGDGAMLMNSEVNTAVKFGAPAVWVVLNDARYGMCAQGMATLGLVADTSFPEVDFAALARALGAGGVRVAAEGNLADALDLAMAASGPFVVDVRIDPSRPAPAGARNRGLRAQIRSAADPGAEPPREAAFPVRAT